MNYILNIHTSTETAIVNACDGDRILTTATNSEQRDHAAFLHSAIQQILLENGVRMQDLKAIGVTAGPGSYTGIRVGLATAKGLCYGLKIPLLLFNTLEVMALTAIENISRENALYCPMIDARRKEVFMAVYDHRLNTVKPPSSFILNENFFDELLQKSPIYFSGSGSEKFKQMVTDNPNMLFDNQLDITSESLCHFSWARFQKAEFTNPSLAHPFYLKEFYLGKN